MVNNNRAIENAWSMLKYLYFELRQFKDIDISGIDKLDDLYALVICHWSTALAKEGLYKEYIVIEDEELESPRGQINIAESISRQTQLRGTLVCSYDELSADIYINHVIKGMLLMLSVDKSVSDRIKVDIKKALLAFNGIQSVDINRISWKTVKFNNNNIRYKHLIELCKTLCTEKKAVKSHGMTDNDRLYILFKKQVLKYYLTEYKDDTVELFEQPFTLESESAFEKAISKSQRLVGIRTDSHALLIEIRMQDDMYIKHPEIAKQRLYELVQYVQNYQEYYRVKTSGAIIYVNTDPKKLNLEPIRVNAVDHVMVGEVTVDINDFWKYIKVRMDDVYKYFILKHKTKVK